MTRWEQFYKEFESILSTPPSKSVKRAADLFSKHDCRVVLDLGCGVGRDSFYLGGTGFRVIGVDLAHSGLRIAKRLKRKAQRDSVFARAAAQRIPLPDESVDGVYCFGLLHEFTNDKREDEIRNTMKEIYRVLAPAGMLVLTVLSGEPEQGLPHVYLFSEQEFDASTQDFTLIEKEEFSDIGCTGKDDYKIWYGVFTK